MTEAKTKEFTLWFAGLSGSAKTNVLGIVRDKLRERGITNVKILDDDVQIESDKEKPEESADKIIRKLEEIGYIPKQSREESSFSQEEEEKIKKRLRDLGYIE